jgi:hypothetical protein
MTQRLGKVHRGRCSDRTFGQGSIREPGEETKCDVSRLRRCFWRLLHAANEVLPGKSLGATQADIDRDNYECQKDAYGMGGAAYIDVTLQ